MQNKPQWEPDWYLESLLNIHIDEMVDRYACLRALESTCSISITPLSTTCKTTIILNGISGYSWIT